MIFAYLDPVTGSALIQAALGAMAAVGLGWQYVRKGYRTIWGKLHSNTTNPEPASEPPVLPHTE